MLHPRRAKYDRFWARQVGKLQRLPSGVLTTSTTGPSRPVWIDYFPGAPGTIAEKMVFAELARRDITFYFSPYWGDMPFTEGTYERARPDFIIPEYRIILEVYGAYWHTKQDSARRDATRALMYTAAGYKYYKLWDYEIFAGVREALNQVPELVHPAIQTGKIYLSDRPWDPSASLRAQRKKGPKVVRLRVSGMQRTALSRFEPHLHPPKQVNLDTGPGFKGLTIEQIQKAQYGLQWRDHLLDLARYFETYPSARLSYRTAYKYLLKWGGWWTKWQTAMSTTQEYREWIRDLDRYFGQFPSAKRIYLSEYYRWLSWRRMSYRRT